MTKLLRVAALVAAFMVVGAAPAAGGNALTASLAGTETAAPPTGCPPAYVITVLTDGTGVLTSEAYSGAVGFSARHCTRLVSENPEAQVTVGRADFGELMLVTPNGDMLHADYQGPFVSKGVFPSNFRTDFSGRYSITGGTGIFENASGSGSVGVIDLPSGATWTLNGSLNLPS